MAKHPRNTLVLLSLSVLLPWNGLLLERSSAFLTNTIPFKIPSTLNAKAKGFGKVTSKSRGFGTSTSKSQKKSASKSSKSTKTKAKPYVKSDQEQLLQSLIQSSSESALGKVITDLQQEKPTIQIDPFYEMLPTLILSKFPNASSEELSRVSGFLHHALLHNDIIHQKDSFALLEDDITQNSYKDDENIHAYMPGLGPTQPFYDQAETLFPFVKELEDNYEIIKEEFKTLFDNHADKFQSVTEMNYESGWNTLLLFYNNHVIDNFPYNVCPVTTNIIKKIPLGGRIVGFNRQKPNSGIPKHTDGNNMWLTCQLGVQVPEGNYRIIAT